MTRFHNMLFVLRKHLPYHLLHKTSMIVCSLFLVLFVIQRSIDTWYALTTNITNTNSISSSPLESPIDEEATLISINTAPKTELMKLPHIGNKKADDIIAYRTEQSFTALEQLQEVKGIGTQTYQKLKDHIKL